MYGMVKVVSIMLFLSITEKYRDRTKVGFIIYYSCVFKQITISIMRPHYHEINGIEAININ